jgi:hypothetical protein
VPQEQEEGEEQQEQTRKKRRGRMVLKSEWEVMVVIIVRMNVERA